MARDFNGSTDKLDTGLDLGDLSSGTNFTWAGWLLLTSSNTDKSIASVKSNQTNDPLIQWLINSSGHFSTFIRDSADVNLTLTNSAIDLVDSAWHHVGLVRDTTGANKWYTYTDGSQDPSGGTTDTTGQLNMSGRTLYIAARNNQGSEDQNLNGSIAEFATWTRALSDAEMAILGKGYSPLFIPNGIQFYAPIIGRNSPEQDLIGGLSVVVDGAINLAHPPIIYPTTPKIITPPAVAVARRIFVIS